MSVIACCVCHCLLCLQARQLQNELLSAELPAKYGGVALAKAGAIYASGPSGGGSSSGPPGKGRGGGGGSSDAPAASSVFHTTPYEDNRVRLQPTPANRNGYINASHVTVSGGL